MPLLFTCPHCQAKTRVEDRYSGQKGECFQCGGPIEIPSFVARRPARPASGLPPKKVARIIAVVVACGVVLALIATGLQFGSSSISKIASSRSSGVSIRKLESIAKALNNYAAKHGQFPPPVVKGPNGQPMHSWRVMLLPYFSEDQNTLMQVYNSYDRSKPWNDPANLAIQYQIPDVYLHPNVNNTGWGTSSSYYLVVGNGTLFPVSGPLKPSEITDKTSQTILVVEGNPAVASSSWTEPVDLDFVNMTGDLLSGSLNEIGGQSDDTVTMATVDGRGHALQLDTDPAIVRALITPRGGERMDDDTLD
jgi:Protein of unknown function (DUF1559)